MNDAALHEKIMKMSYGWFDTTPCTPESLNDYLDNFEERILRVGLSREMLFADLERLHTVRVPDDGAVLEDTIGHVEWFNLSTNNRLSRPLDWHFWLHYRLYLTAKKNWPSEVVASLDRESSGVLARLEDPLREGPWDRRGMVMGSVQSGKTANYTALIAKAIDAGYRLIVVLAGVHNSLRSQTQYRLNEEILGYDLARVQRFQGDGEAIGVRAMFTEDHRIAQTLTSSSEDGDFKQQVANQAGMIPTEDGPPIVMVIKKHVSIMSNLISWATAVAGQADGEGGRRVPRVPLLVIDDECDYASVNTRAYQFDDNGTLASECEPAKTNATIRRLLNAFSKSAYVGYTATPFANIFIHHNLQHPEYGEDLFPRNFIISLPRPTNYIGPETVFGVAPGVDGESPGCDASPLIRYVDDHRELLPDRHKKVHIVTFLPDSLTRAIKAFLIACAVRRLRKARPHHNAMLIHVTRFTAVQEQVKSLVEEELSRCVDRIRSGSDPLDDFRRLWKDDFQVTSKSLEPHGPWLVSSWKEVLESLYPVAGRVHVTLVNGTSSDTLCFRNAEVEARRRLRAGEQLAWEELGEHVIAVGGDKLSRGLTLDGLTVSYYLRASRMYDTLMQMGRWFGYRDGYLDLCRIYTTQELVDWYRFTAAASMELRQELEYMALVGREPKDFGLKVLDHPGQLAITSAGKRRSSELLDLSYAGRIVETVVFDPRRSEENLQALTLLMQRSAELGEKAVTSSSAVHHWRHVPPTPVIQFLQAYQTQKEAARVVDPSRIADFIQEQLDLNKGDLTEWHVAVIGRKNAKHHLQIGGLEVACVERRPNQLEADKLAIGRLVNPEDEWLDFGEDEKARVPMSGDRPSGKAIREARPKNRGFLLIYAICYDEPGRTYGLSRGQETIGFAISFPGSDTAKSLKYRVNSVYTETEE